MVSTKLSIIGLLLLSQISSAYAQSNCRVIKGHVIVGSENLPLPGASIIVTDTNSGSTADSDRNFRFLYYGDEKEITLIISFIGMTSMERTVYSINEEFDAGTTTLEYDEKALQELVITTTCFTKTDLEKRKSESASEIKKSRHKRILKRN